MTKKKIGNEQKMCCNQYMKSYDSAFFLLHFAVLFFREGKMKKKILLRI